MKIKIFDYDDQPKVIDLGDKPIFHMHIHIWSGDEVLTVIYEDKTRKCFDSSDSRMMSFNDGDYDIENINEFIKERLYEESE